MNELEEELYSKCAAAVIGDDVQYLSPTEARLFAALLEKRWPGLIDTWSGAIDWYDLRLRELHLRLVARSGEQAS